MKLGTRSLRFKRFKLERSTITKNQKYDTFDLELKMVFLATTLDCSGGTEHVLTIFKKMILDSVEQMKSSLNIGSK